MLVSQLTALLALALAAPTFAKKADFKIALGRYADDACHATLTSDTVWKSGHTLTFLHNNKCKTFSPHEAGFESFDWQYRHTMMGWSYKLSGDFPRKYYDDNCEVTVYSEPDCEGEKYPFDAIRSGDQCNAVPFGPYGKSVSLTCNGNPPDRK